MSKASQDAEVILACLEGLLASPVFSKAYRQSAFLRHVVQNSLSGHLEALKEYQIGLTVYERGNAYDTRSDPIVRVEAARLRAKLREYYETYGGHDPVRIELPKGAYLPAFHWSDSSTIPALPPGQSESASGGGPPAAAGPPVWWKRRPSARLLAAAGLISVVAAGIWIARARLAVPAEGMPRSIAILPFRDLSAGSLHRELCDALAESLTEELSRVEGLQVAGRTSTLRLSGRSPDLAALGRQLHVGAVLEGSVQSSGRQIRVRARMFDVASGFQLWSGTFDRSGAEAFSVQDDIARAIATTLRLQLGRRREDPAVVASPARRLSHELYTKGRQLHRLGDPGVLAQAREYHLRSVQADPSYALAHSGLAHIDLTVMAEGLVPLSELRPEIVQSLDRALALDPGLSDAYSARIRLARDIDADWRAVESTCRDATRMFPNAASIRGNCGVAYSILGRFQQAEEELRASVRLDPLWFGGLDGLAWMLYLSGRPEEARRQAEEIMRILPEFRGIRRSYARFLLGSGRLSQARDYLEKEVSMAPESADLWALLGHVRGRQNDKPGAKVCLQRLGARPLEVDQALVWLGLGDLDRAAAHLERGLDKRETAAVELLVDPGLQLGRHRRRLRVKVGL